MASALEKLRKARQGSGTSLASANIGGGMAGSGASGGSALARLRAARSGRTQPTLTPAAQRYAVNNTSSAALKNGPSGTPVPTGESSKNRGGLLGGIGYVGEKIGLGFMQGLEGVVDYVGAGIAELFGNDEASERIISNDWMNYSHADEWFNPGEGWRIAGDVGGGIGTSLPGLAAGVAVTWATGGSGIGAGIGLALSGFSAAGTSTKEAYLESGELGGKEFGYGAIMGGVEVGAEALSGKIGAGLLKGIDEVAGAFGKTAGKTAKALTAKTLAWDMTKEFASEAFEEGFSEWISPYAKRFTYDPKAKNATIEEISYAALIGGLSGLAMGGGRVGVSQLARNVEGNAAVKEGRVSSIMDTAKAFSDYEGEHPTKLSSLEAIRDLYTRLDSQGVRTATELTGNQRRALGELQALTTTAVFEPAMQKSALSAIAGADAIAEKLNADGNVKIVDGRMQVVTSDILAELQKKGAEVRDITAEDIRGGVDVKSGKSIREALKKKDVLRYVVASDVAGRFLMTAKEVETAARAGTKIKSQVELNKFIQEASPEQRAALGRELGIADDEWYNLDIDRFNEAAIAYRESGKLEQRLAENAAKKAQVEEALAKNPGAWGSVPLSEAKRAVYDGVDRPDMKAQKEKASEEAKRMSMDTIGEGVQTPITDTAKPTNEKVAALKEKLDAKKVDEYLRENVEEYSSLGEPNKIMIRQVVLSGRATGISDADTLRYARMAVKTGVNVTFDKQATYKGKNKVGEDVYHAAVYDPENNRIIVNPETKKKHTVLLMHELSHAMRKYVKDGKIAYAFDEDTKLSKDMWKAIKKYYAGKDGKLDAELALDEASAYYAEALFGTDTAIDLLLGKKQTLKEKILSFFAKSAEYYSSDSALSKEARRQFRKYKKMFDSFAERNQYRNAEGAKESTKRTEVVNEIVDKSARRAAMEVDNGASVGYTKGNNVNGGITNGTEQKADNRRGGASNTENERSGARETDGERSRVQNTVGEQGESNQENGSVQRQHTGVNSFDNEWILDSNNYIVPAQDSALHKAQSELVDDYGIETHIVKASAWKREAKATTHYEKVYISEDIDEDLLRTVQPHEATHAIKQLGFKPYLEFIEQTPTMLNMSSKSAQRLLGVVVEHIGYDVENISDVEQLKRIYDELNATVYGWTVTGAIFDTEYDLAWVPDAFNDFATYFNELSAIHEQFKAERKSTRNSGVRASMDISPELEAARGSIVMDLSSYKPKGRKETIEYGKAVGDDAFTRFQIQATNQQAGLEKELKRLGVKNGEALVQSARSASNAAATMIGDVQMRIGDGSYEVQGEGLEKIYHPILNGEAIESEFKGLSKKEREARLEEYSSDFFAYLFHMHSADRMSLEEKSIVENKKNIEGLAEKVQRRKDIETELKSISDDITSISHDMDAKLKEIKQLGKSRKKEINELRKELRGEWQNLRLERKKLYEQQSVLRKEKSELNALLKDAIMENKPVLGHAVDADGKTVLTTAEDEAIPYTAEESKAIAEEILKLHPEFKEAAEKVWAYNKNLNQYRVDAGLISQESFDRMQELYPHYVPTYREGSRTGIAAMSGKYALKVKATVKSARGGLRPLCRPDVIMARQTEETIKAGRVNQLARTYYDAAETETNKGVNAMRVISRVDAKADETIDFDPTTIAPKNNRVTFYKNGEKIEMEVDKNVFDGFDAFNSQTDMGGIITGTLGKVMDLYKRLITSYSPIFTIRNAIRDLQDAGINTKYGKTFLKNYLRAINEIRTNGKYWQMYRAAGGLSSSLFDFERGFGGSTNSWGLTKAEGNPLEKLGTTIENANVFIEQLPRLAEFISSMEAKNSIEQAILDSADVTTNFGRSGKMAKWLNRNFIPFLNPSIQGFSKLVRNITDRKTAKELVAFLIKAALLGFVPQIINQLLLGDDDEYEKLRDSDKENNYIIRAGDQFIKIPKGRVVAAMAGIVNRTVNTANGKEDAWEGYLDSVLQNITPVDSASRDIFSPFRDVKANKTWYGTDIEGRQFEGVPVEERTDEGTSWIAEVLAQLPTSKAAELSPKKIHYLIDQYTGIIGDIVLPATSKKAQKDMFSGAFVIDPVVSNDLSNRFYKQYDKAVETRNSTKSTEDEIETASFRYKYLGKIKDTVSDMQKLKREVQASDLKATEKLKQTREIQAAINLMYEEALADIDKLTELYNGTYYLGAADIYSNYVASGITDEQYASLRYAETIRSYYGAETALSQYNSAVYEKAVLFNKAGLDYDTYYEYYFTTRGIESDVDRRGEVVAGSKKKKTLAAIRALGVSQNERLLLTAAAGYALSDGEKRRLLSHIMRLGVSKEEKAAIAEACGFKVKNGRISMK